MGKFVSSSKDKLHFKVQKLWKGQVGNDISLHENYWTEFIPGEDYIVFAGKDEFKIATIKSEIAVNTVLIISG